MTTDPLKRQLQLHLQQQRHLMALWSDRRRPLHPDRRALPIDYLLAPGTDEGDASTAYRRDRYEAARARAEATRAYMANHYRGNRG